MTSEETKQKVLETAKEIDGKKKLSCAQAFQLHVQNGMSLKEIGDTCNDNGVKISSCQLGCFR